MFQTRAIQARTMTIRQALVTVIDPRVSDDLLFLERWEQHASPALADLLRARQIRRANPRLAADLRSELQAIRRRAEAGPPPHS